MKIRTNTKAGAITLNHNQPAVLPRKTKKQVKTGVKAGLAPCI
jgi:hypothetical protein